MPSSLPTSLLDVESQPGKPPMLRVEATADAATWVGEQREALRAVVAGRGSVLVRGLELRDAAEFGAVLQRLATAPMAEKEAFAPVRPTPTACTPRRRGRRTSRCACITN